MKCCEQERYHILFSDIFGAVSDYADGFETVEEAMTYAHDQIVWGWPGEVIGSAPIEAEIHTPKGTYFTMKAHPEQIKMIDGVTGRY